MEKSIELIFCQRGVLFVQLFGASSGVIGVLSASGTHGEIEFSSLKYSNVRVLVKDIERFYAEG